MEESLLTVVTPTYNRAHTLPACYKSLLSQTDRRFVWMVIDDGSSDNTEDLVNGWINDNKIKILYYKKQNGGKASALNLGINKLNTLYAVCLDSDDTFFPEGVEHALEELEKHKNDAGCCGVLALRNNPDGTVMGGREIPKSMTTITAEDVFLKLNLRTELVCFYKVNILKQFRFPVFPGEKFVSPAWMQYTITQRYYYSASWEKICCCEYVEDGLTRNKREVIIKNPHGYTSVKRFSFDLAPTFKLRVKHGIMYDCGCILGHDKDWLKNTNRKGFAVLLCPIGYFLSKTRFRDIR